MQSKLSSMLEMGRLGGRVREVDPSTHLVLDLSQWSDSAHQELLREFPYVRVDIESCADSLGGFAVRIRNPEPETRRTLFWLALMAGLGSVAAHALRLF